MATVVIDDDGGVWDGASHELRRHYDTPHSNGAFVQYAVINLGFVAVDRFRQSCQLRFRPRVASERALEAAKAWLDRRDHGARIALAWFDTDWNFEICNGAPMLLRRMDELTLRYQQSARSLLSVTRGYEAFRSEPNVEPILQQWSKLPSPMTQAALASLLRNSFGERYVLVQRDPSNSKLVFEDIGAGMFRDQLPWRDRAAGKPIEAQPDETYGRWISDAYEQAAAGGEPLVQDVDAIVKWPGRGRSRVRYRRLIAPFRSQNGQQTLLGASIIDPTIDLRANRA